MIPARKKVTNSNRGQVTDACWEIASALPVFGYAEIAAGQNICTDQAIRIVLGWLKAGLIVPMPPGHGQRKQWKTIETADHRRQQRVRTREDNIWTAMRGLKQFSPTDLAAHAHTDILAVSVDQAQAYCRALLASAHLTVARKAVHGRKEAMYRLVRNTGPHAPRERRVRAVIDDNTDAVVVISGVAP